MKDKPAFNAEVVGNVMERRKLARLGPLSVIRVQKGKVVRLPGDRPR